MFARVFTLEISHCSRATNRFNTRVLLVQLFIRWCLLVHGSKPSPPSYFIWSASCSCHSQVSHFHFKLQCSIAELKIPIIKDTCIHRFQFSILQKKCVRMNQFVYPEVVQLVTISVEMESLTLGTRCCHSSTSS